MLVHVGVHLVGQVSGEAPGAHPIYHRAAYEGSPEQYLDFRDARFDAEDLAAYLFPCLRFFLHPFFYCAVLASCHLYFFPYYGDS